MGDRLVRALLVASGVGLAWGIRGSFGHELGAAYPGAVLGLAFCLATGQRSMSRWMPILGAVAALAIATGGAMSYGRLHGYAKSDTLLNFSYGYFTLFCQGASWGVFGSAFIGLFLERERMSGLQWARMIGAVFLGGFIAYYIIVGMINFDVNPPRSNSSIGYLGAAITLFGWLLVHKKYRALRGAVYGFAGFGIGMFFGRFLGNLTYHFPFDINNWNVMEISAGFFGGLIFTWGMLGYELPEAPKEEGTKWAWLQGFAIFGLLGGIPVLHLIRKILLQRKYEHWVDRFASFQDQVYADPEAMVAHVLNMLYIICFLACLGAVAWLIIHHKRLWQFRAFPVLWLSFMMLLFQNCNSLLFWSDKRENYFDTHYLFWVLFSVMIACTIYVYLRPAFRTRDDAAMDPVAWKPVAAGTVTLYVVVLILSSAGVNGEESMKSAVTRWPEWSFRDGPFPGREE